MTIFFFYTVWDNSTSIMGAFWELWRHGWNSTDRTIATVWYSGSTSFLQKILNNFLMRYWNWFHNHTLDFTRFTFSGECIGNRHFLWSKKFSCIHSNTKKNIYDFTESCHRQQNVTLWIMDSNHPVCCCSARNQIYNTFLWNLGFNWRNHFNAHNVMMNRRHV